MSSATMTLLASALRDLSLLPSASQRAVGAVMGAIVADAATRPFHWVYSQDTIEEALAGSTNDSLEFWPVSMSPFYSIPTGRLSCYADECVSMLRSLPSLSSTEAVVTRDSYTQQLQMRFSPDSDYAHALVARNLNYDGSQRLTHKDPTVGPWQNKSVTTFLATGVGETGINESDGLCFSIPLVAWLAASRGKEGGEVEEDNTCQRDSSFESSVQEAIQTLSASTVSVQHAMCVARLLRCLVVEGKEGEEGRGSFLSIIRELQATQYSGDNDYDRDIFLKIQAVLDEEKEGGEEQFVTSVAKFGKACSFPGSFQGALLAVLSSDSFREGVRKNIRAGGCNCSRANMAGALMGARWGVEPGRAGEEGVCGRGIPVEWIEQTEGGDELLALAVQKFS